MKWTADAEAAIKRVPFFVRKKVIERVETELENKGKILVTVSDLEEVRRRFLKQMTSDIKGFQADICFGPGGCPNRARHGEDLLEQIIRLLEGADLLEFLQQKVGRQLKYHHELRLSIAECPNACSQPQIKDIGLIGTSRPRITEDYCKQCGNCMAVCPDRAVRMDDSGERPRINMDRCLGCGLCAHNCQTGAIVEDQSGWKILLGGKLGRRPRLAREIPGVFSEETVLQVIKNCLDYYKQNSRKGERFAEILNDEAFANFVKIANDQEAN